MDARTRREALRAAAKVALSLAAAGTLACGSTATDADETTASEIRRRAEAGVSNDGGDGGLSLAQCMEKLDAQKEQFGPDADSPIPPVKYERTDEVLACCDTFLARHSTIPNAREHRWNCCATINDSVEDFFQGPTACTPWGPPMPPSMPAALLLEVA